MMKNAVVIISWFWEWVGRRTVARPLIFRLTWFLWPAKVSTVPRAGIVGLAGIDVTRNWGIWGV